MIMHICISTFIRRYYAAPQFVNSLLGKPISIFFSLSVFLQIYSHIYNRFEMLGEPQRDITPEQAAEQLRTCSEIHYKQQK